MDGSSKRLYSGDYPLLEHELLQWIQQQHDADPLAPVFILVPTRMMRTHLSRQLAQARGSHLNVQWLTFSSLVRSLRLSDARPIPKFASDILIEKACNQTDGKLYFEKILDRPGLHRSLLASITDLKESCLNPIQFGRLLKQLSLPETSRFKLESVQRIWQTYERLKREHNWLDETDLHLLAAGNVSSIPCVDQCGTMSVYGFYDFKGMQLSLILALSQVVGMQFYFPFEEDEAWEFARPTRQSLIAEGFESVPLAAHDAGHVTKAPEHEDELPLWSLARVSSESESNGPWQARGLQEVCQNLFHSPKKIPEEPNKASVEIVSCPGDGRESQEVVRAIIHSARNHKTPFHRIAVLGRFDGMQLKSIKEELESLSIQPFVAAGMPIADTRAGKTFELLLAVVEGNLNRRTVMEFLSSGDINFEAILGNSIPPLSQIDTLTKRAGIIQGLDQWGAQLEKRRQSTEESLNTPNRGGGQAKQQELALTEQLTDALLPLLERADGLRSQSDWNTLVEDTAELFEAIVHQSDERDTLVECVESLRQLSPLWADRQPTRPTFASFCRVARQAIEQTATASGQFQTTGPVLAGIMLGRGVPFDTVIVPQLVDRSFPAHVAQDPILLDHERREINSMIAGPIRVPLKSHRLTEEKLLFRLAFGAARRRIILSYSRLDAESGRERFPSPFLMESFEATVGKPSSAPALSEYERRVPLREFNTGDDWPVSQLEYDFSHAMASMDDDPALLQSYIDGSLSPHFAQSIRAETARWSRNELSPYDGLITSDQLLASFRKRSPLKTVISPSRVEEYAECPFKFFHHYVLGIEEIEEPETLTRADPIAKGQMIHSLLEEFLTAMKDQDRLPLDENAHTELIAMARSRFKEFMENGFAGPRLTWHIEQERLMTFLDKFVKREQERQKTQRPEFFELPFGRSDVPDELDSSPPTVDLGDGMTVKFHGVIDRVDLTDDNHFYVIDYKGKKLPQLGKDHLGAGTAMQLAIYQLAAQHTLDPLGDYKPAGGEYFSYDISAKNDTEVSKPLTTELHQRLVSVLRAIVTGIDNGNFMQYPKRQTCAYCAYSASCMGTQHALAPRKSNSPQAKSFLAIKSHGTTAALEVSNRPVGTSPPESAVPAPNSSSARSSIKQKPRPKSKR